MPQATTDVRERIVDAAERDQVILEVLLRDLRRFLHRLALRLGEQTSVLAIRGSSCAALSSPPS